LSILFVSLFVQDINCDINFGCVTLFYNEVLCCVLVCACAFVCARPRQNVLAITYYSLMSTIQVITDSVHVTDLTVSIDNNLFRIHVYCLIECYSLFTSWLIQILQIKFIIILNA